MLLILQQEMEMEMEMEIQEEEILHIILEEEVQVKSSLLKVR